MFGLGGAELCVIIAVALLVFGPSKLPQVARAVKAGYAEFRKLTEQVHKTVEELRQDIDLNLDPRLEDGMAGGASVPPANKRHGGKDARPTGETAAQSLPLPIPVLRPPQGVRAGLRPPEAPPVRALSDPLPVAAADDYLARVSVPAGEAAADDYLAEAAP